HYKVSMQATGLQIDGSPLSELITVDDFSYPDDDAIAAVAPLAEESQSSAASEAEVAPVDDENRRRWVYAAIAVANLVVLILGFIAYRVIAGKDSRQELEEMEKTLQMSPGSSTNANLAEGGEFPESAVIDLAEDIPMSGEAAVDLSLAD